MKLMFWWAHGPKAHDPGPRVVNVIKTIGFLKEINVLWAQGPGPMTQGSGPRPQAPGPRPQDPEPRAQGPEPRAQGSGLRAQRP